MGWGWDCHCHVAASPPLCAGASGVSPRAPASLCSERYSPRPPLPPVVLLLLQTKRTGRCGAGPSCWRARTPSSSTSCRTPRPTRLSRATRARTGRRRRPPSSTGGGAGRISLLSPPTFSFSSPLRRRCSDIDAPWLGSATTPWPFGGAPNGTLLVWESPQARVCQLPAAGVVHRSSPDTAHSPPHTPPTPHPTAHPPFAHRRLTTRWSSGSSRTSFGSRTRSAARPTQAAARQRHSPR